MGEGPCKGTNDVHLKKSVFEKKTFTQKNLNEHVKPKNLKASQSLWIEGTTKTVKTVW